MSLMNRQRSNALYWLNVPVLLVAIYGGWQLFNTRRRKVLKADEFQELELVEKTILSYNTAIYRFKLPRPNDVLGLPTGQHVSISADVEGQSKPVVRSYTPISDDETPGYVDLIIKSYPTGTLSKHIASLGVGQTLKFRGPKGAMEYTPNMAKRIGMIAGGTGITPMLQVAKAIVRGRAKGDKTEVDLIFANVKFSDILLKDELDKLAQLDSGFRVYYVLNDPPENWKGGVGFVTTDMIKEKLPAPAADVKIFICGPPPMVSAMKKSTESLGFDKARGFSKRDDQVFCF